MARKSEFTDEDIIQAGTELSLAGHPVSGWALRTKLGGGNPGRLMEVWTQSGCGPTILMDDINRKSGLAIAQAVKDFTTQLDAVMAERLNGMAKNQARLVDDAVSEAADLLHQAEERIHSLEVALPDSETRAATAEARELAALVTIARLQGELEAMRQTSQRRMRMFTSRTVRLNRQLEAS